MTALSTIVEGTYRVVLESGFFLLAGFLLAGFLHEFVDTGGIARFLGGRDLRSIVTATLLGAPLPLCSCGVLPAAVELRRKGASREATVAFLISTPETGVDSIALTYGLLGPLMAVVRPLTAVATGIVAGAVSLLAPFRRESEALEPAEAPVPCDGSCQGSQGEGQAGGASPPRTVRERVAAAFRYAFVTMMDELAFWLLLAFVVSGLLAGLLPQDFFTRFLPSPLASVLVMALLGLPTYVCASASTPMAAAMLAKGLNPGAALVFMLTGPATNASTTALVARLFGRRFVAVYVGAIFGVAVAAGLLLDAAIGSGWVRPPVPPAPVQGGLFAAVELVSAFAFLTLLALSLKRRGLGPGLREAREHGLALARLVRSTPRPAVSRRRLGGLLALLFLLGWGATAVLVVSPGERGVVRLLGRVTARDLPPGLHLVPPIPFGAAETVDVARTRVLEVGFRQRPTVGLPATFVSGRTPRVPDEAQYVTGDENVVDVAAVVTYRVADASRFRFGADRPEAALHGLVRGLLLEAIGTTTIDAFYSGERGKVERDVLARLRESEVARATGIAPLDVRLLYVHAPDEVHAAFRDIASAAEDRTTARNKALVDAEGTLGQARGEAARTRAEAESARVSAVESARGEAAAFVPLAREVGRAPEGSRRRLSLEALERALPGRAKVIRPRGRGSLELWVVPPAGSPAVPSLSPSTPSATAGERKE